MCANDTDATTVCNDVLKRFTAKVDASARQTMKMELRRDVINRFDQFRHLDEEDSVRVVLDEKMQQRLQKYLQNLKARSK